MTQTGKKNLNWINTFWMQKMSMRIHLQKNGFQRFGLLKSIPILTK